MLRSSSNATIGWASTISPIVAGTFSISISRRPLEMVLPHRVAIVGGRVPRDVRQRRGRDRHAEEPDRQIHQTERILQPRDGALRLGRGERRVDEHVDLHRGQAERARPHQAQDFADARIAEVEDRPVAEALLPQRRPLDGDLADAPEHACQRDGGDLRQAEAAISGTSRNAHRIVATLNIAGESAGRKKRRSEFNMPIIATATATVVRNGIMIRVSCVVSSSFPGTAVNPSGTALCRANPRNAGRRRPCDRT